MEVPKETKVVPFCEGEFCTLIRALDPNRDWNISSCSSCSSLSSSSSKYSLPSSPSIHPNLQENSFNSRASFSANTASFLRPSTPTGNTVQHHGSLSLAHKKQSKKQEAIYGRDRAKRILRRLLADSELSRLDKSGKILELSIPQRIIPWEVKNVPKESIELTKREHRLAFLELASAEEEEEEEECLEDHHHELDGNLDLRGGSPTVKNAFYHSNHQLSSTSTNFVKMIPTEQWNHWVEMFHTNNLLPSRRKESQNNHAVVCSVCYHVYRLLNRTRYLLSNELRDSPNDCRNLDESSKDKEREARDNHSSNSPPPSASLTDMINQVLNGSDRDDEKEGKDCLSDSRNSETKVRSLGDSSREISSDGRDNRTEEPSDERVDEEFQQKKDKKDKPIHTGESSTTKSSKVQVDKMNRSRKEQSSSQQSPSPKVKLKQKEAMKNNELKNHSHTGTAARPLKQKSKEDPTPGERSTSSSTKNISTSKTGSHPPSKNIDRDPNLLFGTVDFDSDTSFPYTILSNEDNSSTESDTCFNMVICHDIFDTFDRLKVLLSPIISRHTNSQILLWNYPGQAYTKFPLNNGRKKFLNNDFFAECLDKLLIHVGVNGTNEFDSSRPFHLMGYGLGGAVSCLYAANYEAKLLRAVLLVNPLTYVDTHYASVMHDCRNVFFCTPETRPDLPVYFYSRFLFSDEYLEKVTSPLALNLHAAVHNPISLKGRLNLCSGVLSNVDVRPMMKKISVPIISVHGEKSGLVRPLHSASILDGREVCTTIFKALNGGVHQKKSVVIFSPGGGHELLQEKKKSIITLIEQLLCGYHEKNNVVFSMKSGNVAPISVVQNHEVKEKDKTDESFFKATPVEASNSNTYKMMQALKSQKNSTSNTSSPQNRSQIDKRKKSKKIEQDKKTDENTDNLNLPFLDLMEEKKVKEYMSWRLERNRKRLSRYVRAAQVIQNALRVFMAKTMISRLKRNVAATEIQSCYRGLIGRRLYMQKRKELWAAKFVQRAYRGSMGRKQHKMLQRAVQAQISLAKKWRGVLSRTRVQKIVERRNSAAVIIQCLWRRSNAKNIAFHRRLRNNSSILIQRIYRGHLGRSKANSERDRYLFSLNQSRGVEIGQQLLIEHKMQASKLQSEVNILNSEKKIVESRVDDVMKEISSFQDTVNDLERSMHQMSLVQATRQSSTEAMHAIREQRMQLDQRFSTMITKISDRKNQLKTLEEKLSRIKLDHQSKTEELRVLERKLVALLEAQENGLGEIRRRQEQRFSSGADQNKSSSNYKQVVESHGPSEKEKVQAAQLVDSTETMMKFGFMSMSMTYFSSLNMIRAMKTMSVDKTLTGHKSLESIVGNTPKSTIAKNEVVLTTKKSFDVDNWNVDNVVQWLSNIGLSQYTESFRDGSVDGPFLSQLNDDDLRNILGVEHQLHRKKILFNISQLLSSSANSGDRVDSSNESEDDTVMSEVMDVTTSNNLQTRDRYGDGKQQTPIKVQPSTTRPEQEPNPKQIESVTKTKPEKTVDTPKPVVQKQNAPPSPPFPSLDNLIRWTRSKKLQHIQESLGPIPSKLFDKTNVRVQYVEGIGTVYNKDIENQRFHLNKADEHGNTLLHIAAQNGSIRLGKFLLEKGLNPNHQNKQGQTPGHFAVAYQFFDFASWLFDAGGGNDLLTNIYGLGPYDGLTPDED